MGKREADEEDLAIQNTLSMTAEERLELLAALIVDKITQDQKQDESLYSEITEAYHA